MQSKKDPEQVCTERVLNGHVSQLPGRFPEVRVLGFPVDGHVRPHVSSVLRDWMPASSQ